MRSLASTFPHPLIAAAVGMAAVLLFLSVNTLFLVWLERKVSARIQRRRGPTEVGPCGLLQTLADMVKLISKQLITPENVNRPLYLLAPVLAFAPIPAAVALLPFDEGVALIDSPLSLAILLALSGLNMVAIFAAGWGSNNKYALLGAMRSIAQGISYEIPLVLSALAVALMARSASLAEIAGAQAAFPFILVQPVAATIFFIAALAETNRAPFDIPEAESELVAGFHTEYSGMRFAMFFFAEYSHMTIAAGLAATLFLGGWHGPFLPGWLWFLLKIYALVLVMMWVRWTFPRLRFDQLMRFSWVTLAPLALFNLLATIAILRLT